MKKIILVTIFLLFTTSAYAGNYVKGSIGIFMLEESETRFESGEFEATLGDITSDTGFGLSAAVGHSFSNGLDIELEYSYKEAELDEFEGQTFQVGGDDYKYDDWSYDESVSIKTLMANGIYNLKNASSLTPYLGAGIGFGWVNADTYDETKFAYQLLAGIEAEVSKTVSILVGYRYLGMGDVTQEETRGVTTSQGLTLSADGEDSASVDAHNIEFGLKYSF